MKFGYARVSGLSQDLEQQKAELMEKKIDPENIYAEKFTGTTKERPEWEKLNRQLRKGDEVYFTKVDRIGRSVKVAVEIVDDLLARGVKVFIIQLGGYVDKNNPMGKMTFNFLTVMAEFEHDLIVGRLAEGKAYAKAHNPNFKEGRPKRRMTDRYKKVYEYSLTHSIRETALTTGVSESTVKRIKRDMKKLKAKSEAE